MKIPFYKKKWFWISIISFFIIISTTAFVVENTYDDKADENLNQEDLFKKTKDSDTSIIDKFNKVKIGAKGNTLKRIEEVFGSPTITSNTSDRKNATLTWQNLKGLDDDVVIDITFQDGVAVSKSIKGLDIDRRNDLRLSDYNKVKENDSYDQVINLLGNPDNYIESGGVVTLTYTSDVEEKIDDASTYIEITLSNNKVTSKSQLNVK
ncbi:DUF3862 domain-containing protein (plasmid) [Companilactobacillus allii]|uniref:DUF3862 domain-containing protein n=1 Tax=Companilactobacillus allii TaxID=1847728 RepID=A0A1P8Q629_9LACO|nr:DUF3862 domain-containing protein [Companilactobacillus allii]APX73275.1 hypothetical protein BTM29_12280 [Companilactobacillus allii]USQ68090.1 DUF3862 domain-containing protein [Companilactobacillus allii]USQ69938.1 DUF3862 domain-containing protein [Companilactobacillus allii]